MLNIFHFPPHLPFNLPSPPCECLFWTELTDFPAFWFLLGFGQWKAPVKIGGRGKVRLGCFFP